ncbi:hypothetical protein [Methanococcoides sp. AM1]|uniref:hypothetical protein n=1 Tax=Methanococcoides sp. AM1 TaxID=1201011 RepID=UPI001083B2E9|nr:hypothetical protein [Methanococcoides sp. AM1]
MKKLNDLVSGSILYIDHWRLKDWSKIIIIISIFLIGGFTILYSIDYSSIWVHEHIGIDSYQFVGNLHLTNDVNYQNLNYSIDRDVNYNAIENLEEIVEVQKKRSIKLLFLISLGYILILGIAIFSYFKKDRIEHNFNKDFENNIMAIVGTFLGICFGLSSGSYLLLISLRKEYLFQLLILITQNIPYEKLPIVEWDASYQTLCISYVGFGIISLLLSSSLLLQIVYLKFKIKNFKLCSDAYLFTAIAIAIEVFYILSKVDHYY